MTFTSLVHEGQILNGNKFHKFQVLYTSRLFLFLLYGVPSLLSACVTAGRTELAFYLAKDTFIFFFLPGEGGKALAQAAQRNCECLILGSVQDRAGWGCGKPHLVEGIHGRGVDL